MNATEVRGFVLETPGEEMLEGLENLNALRALR